MRKIAAGTYLYPLSRVDSRALDRFWRDTSTGKYPIIDLQGNLGYSLLSDDGLLFIRNDFTVSTYAEYELVFGSIFFPDTVQELISKDKVLLLMVYRKGTQNLLLSELDVDTKYMLDLPHGQYYFIAFILDAGYEALLNSRIYAIGFPSKDNLNSPEHEDFYLNHPADIMEFVDPTPVNIDRGGPFYLNLIMIDVEKVPDCSTIFSELLQEDESSPSL